MSQRDVFFETVTAAARDDDRICVVVADMGAPGLNEFARLYPHRFINVGIAEQNAILVACGLAAAGFRPFVFAIMPFITLRCYEQIKVVASLMNLPITIVGVGSGVSYEEAGPTHHALEDTAIMRILPHMTVWNCSSDAMAHRIAEEVTVPDFSNGLGYVRLDRQDISPVNEIKPLPNSGVIHHKRADDGKGTIVTTGVMVSVALNVAAETGHGVVEIFRLPLNGSKLFQYIGEAPVYALAEENVYGGFCSAVSEALSRCSNPVHCRGMYMRRAGYSYQYRRDAIHHDFGLDKEALIQWLSD